MNGSGVRVGILGASGQVGREFLKVLSKRDQLPLSELTLLASARSAGSVMEFRGKRLTVQEVTEKSFAGLDIVLASAGGAVSKQWGPIAAQQGCVFIDNSSAFRMEKDVPLIVPEVNGHALKNHKNLIANPNCSTAQLVVVLKILHELAGLKRVIVSTYQSVSGAGKEGVDELANQTKALVVDQSYPPKKFQKQIAFNLIPHIDSFADDGYTKEELKVINETRKILELPDLLVTCTAVRVPVMIGHSEVVTVDLERTVSPAQVRESLANSPIVEVWDQPENNIYPTPLDCAGEDPVYVGRIRRDTSSPNGMNLWVVADNLRIGAALNAVRIAEYMVKHNLVGQKV
ncbi:MAG: aspartate-semialdehyde dehydrogenase [Candidatus Obscuribacterales bacterium]|nr:aspartate-semialdehyde dehydrogenase [Candidatus Obscuribacterales bacterium]